MKKLANLKPGAYFFYGGVQWVVLENDEKIGATLAIAAEPVFNRAFDEENRNDWRVSSLRRELNGPFFDALIAEGANRAASPTWEDVTQAVTSGSKFFFSNTTKTATAWGFNFRIKVKRNTATGDCFISSVGGNFE